MLKCIAVDMDGTALDSNTRLPLSTINTFKAAMDKGVMVIPCSGRSLKGIPDSLKNIGIRYVITANGAKITDIIENRELYSDVMAYQDLLEVIDYFMNYDVILYVHHNGSHLAHHHNLERFRDIRPNHKIPADAGDLREKIMHEKMSCEKMGILFFDEKEKEEALKDAHFKNIAVVSTSVNSIEAVSKTASKGHALGWLCDLLGISKDMIMAIGDNDNDLSMFDVADIKVAMANANENVKKKCNYLTLSNDEDGVSYAIREFMDVD